MKSLLISAERTIKMIRVVIADDEQTIRQGLEKVVPWAQNGYEIVGVFKNGTEVLEFFKNDHADIVITDIKMPQMDGLQLLENLRLYYPNLPIIFISGYDEFEFARKALNSGAFAYILKPIDIDELLGVLENACQKIKLGDGDSALKGIIDNLFTTMNSDLNKDFPSTIRYEAYHFCVLNIRCRYNDVKSNLSILHFLKIIKQTISNKLSSNNYCLVESSPHGIVFCIYATKSEQLKSDINDVINRICADVGISFVSPVGIWAGGIYKGTQKIIDSYIDSFSDDSFKGSVTGEEESLPINENFDYDAFNILFNTEDEIIAHLVSGEFEKSKEKLINGKEYILNNNLTSMDAKLFTRNFLYKYISALKNDGQLKEYALSPNILSFLNLSGIEEIFREFVSVLENIYVLSKPIKPMPFDQYITKIKALISENYADPYLSLSEIASYVGLNPSYLSAEFSKSQGVSLINYLMDFRIEKAKKLLLRGSEKIADISPLVGYINPTYFSTIFKKSTGYTPSEFRRVHISE